MQNQSVERPEPIFDAKKMMAFARKSVADYRKKKENLLDREMGVPMSQDVHNLAKELFQSVWNAQKKLELSWSERFTTYAYFFEAFRKEMKEAVAAALHEYEPPKSPMTITRTLSDESLDQDRQEEGVLSPEYAHTTNYLFMIDGQHQALQNRSEHELHMRIEEFMTELSRNIDTYDTDSLTQKNQSFKMLDRSIESISKEFGLSEKQLVPYIYGAFQHKEKRANPDLKKAQALFTSYKDRVAAVSVKMAELESLIQPNGTRDGTAIRKAIRDMMDITDKSVESVVASVKEAITAKYQNNKDIIDNLDKSIMKSPLQNRLLIAGSLLKREYGSSKAVILKKQQ